MPIETISEQRKPAGAYPSLSLLAQTGESTQPLTDNVWLFTGVRMNDVPATSTSEPLVLAGETGCSGEHAFYSDADSKGLFWSSPLRYVPLPGGRLWEPPLANQKEPRMAAKFSNANSESTIDTAIGGVFSIGRLTPCDRPNEGIEIDGMAAAFTRFNQRRLLTAADYRVGLYSAYAKNSWSAKFGYEHTSSHLGDEYIEVTGRLQVPHVRDELVVGLAKKCWNQLRLYGQAGYSVSTSRVLAGDRDRYNFGAEWSADQTTGLKGQPFSALDFDIRSDQSYDANVTFQLGWEWKRMPSRQSARLALELYRGRSPYGQFYQDREHWTGFTMALDW